MSVVIVTFVAPVTNCNGLQPNRRPTYFYSIRFHVEMGHMQMITH